MPDLKRQCRDLSKVDQEFVCFGSPMSYFSMKVWLGLSYFFPKVSTFKNLTPEFKEELHTRSGTHQVS